MKHIWKVILLAITLIAITNVPIANAYPVYPHEYVQKEVDKPMTGAYTSITKDQDDLSNVYGQFINKEMWMAFSNNQWIETGTTRGPINASDYTINDWHGHFMAWGNNGNYGERDFQAQYPTGSHSFQISKDSGNWTVYIDYTRIATVPIFNNYATASYQIVGIESSDTSNAFVSGTYASAMQFRNTSGSWVTWDAPGFPVYDTSSNNLGWYSNYSSSSNRIYYYHP